MMSSWSVMADYPSAAVSWGLVEEGWRKGPWTVEEDKLLIEYVKLHGEGRWNSVSRLAGLKRNGKSCRLRWVNYLRPDLKKCQITPHEERIILELHARWGNRWSTIARSLPGRTDNEIKNYWRTHFKKKTNKTSIDNSEKSRARLLRKQQFQLQQQQQMQMQMQQQAQILEMKRIMSLLGESENKVVSCIPQMKQDTVATGTGAMFSNMAAATADANNGNDQQGFIYSTINNSVNRVIVQESSNEEDMFWDGLWNMDDLNSNFNYSTIAATNRAAIAFY